MPLVNIGEGSFDLGSCFYEHLGLEPCIELGGSLCKASSGNYRQDCKLT